MKLNVFGQEIVVKNAYCTTDINTVIEAKPSLRLYIKLTDECLANCKFCANDNNKDLGTIDFSKLEFVIRYLLERGILHGISITGGEPMHDPTKLMKALSLIWGIDENIEVAISTNGENLREFADYDDVNKLESIHISRHHYLDFKNQEIFRTKRIATTDDIEYLQDNLSDKKIININTMVMKSGINNLEEIKKMLNYVSFINVYKNGFVSLMKCNDYAEEQFINFNDIFQNLDDNFFLAHHFYSCNYCECVDGLYLSNQDKVIEFYARMVKECSVPYTTQLVYTSDNKVRAGFDKKVLLK